VAVNPAVVTSRATGGRRRRVVVLSRKSLDDHPYPTWLSTGERPADVVLLAEDTAATRAQMARADHGYAQWRLFGDWKRNRLVDLAVLEAHAEFPLDGVVALSECDQVRAAHLRRRLGLTGPGPEAAIAYRHKATMKRAALAGGVPVPRFTEVSTIHDLLAFAEAVAGPVVVKPVDGAGSAAVHRLDGPAEVLAWAEQARLDADRPAALVAEEYLNAPMFSVDGLARSGRVLFALSSRYTRTPLDSLTRLLPHGLLALDPGDPQDVALRATAARVVAALPPVEGLHSFHCELFLDPTRGPVLCEIAARTGGGNIRWFAERMLGIDLEAEAARGQSGHPAPRAAVPDAGTRVAGDVLFPWPDRAPRRLPGRCPVPGVVTLTDRSGSDPGRARPAVKSSEYVVDATMIASTHAELTRVYDDVVAWVGAATG
jgi:hypothetical protein